MSTIITHSMELGIPSILINAAESRTVITGVDMTSHLIQIYGDAKSPFVLGVRFIDCTIVAENLRAFEDCYFDQTCTMKVKNMPLCGVESINNNCIIQHQEAK